LKSSLCPSLQCSVVIVMSQLTILSVDIFLDFLSCSFGLFILFPCKYHVAVILFCASWEVFSHFVFDNRCFVLFFGGTGVWTQGFVLANKHSAAAWATLLVHFTLVILEMGSFKLFTQHLDPPDLSLPNR
jgi:hypothetical protein